MNSSTPSPLDMWLLRWVIAPFAVLYLIWTLVSNEFMKYRCQRIAEELGYIESTYFPTRDGTGESCICKMKRNPDGSIDENARLVIDLDMWKRKMKRARRPTDSPQPDRKEPVQSPESTRSDNFLN